MFDRNLKVNQYWRDVVVINEQNLRICKIKKTIIMPYQSLKIRLLRVLNRLDQIFKDPTVKYF